MQTSYDFAIGDFVYIEKFKTTGEIIFIDKNKIKLKLRNNFSVSVFHFEIVKTHKNKDRVSVYNNFNQKSYANEKKTFANFLTEIDLHGYKVQEAISYLEKMIELANYYGESNLIIIHGKGSGTLRQVIRNFVKDKKNISFGLLPPDICEHSAISIKINA